MDIIYAVMDRFLPFEWAEYQFMKNAFLAILLITPLFGLVGPMVVNNKMAFFSDALGHSALTGIAIGVLLGVDNYLVSMLGFALLFAICISEVREHSAASADTIIGVFSSVGLALGIVILSAFGGFTKYSNYLIGDILTVRVRDVVLIAGVLVIVLLVWIFFFNKLLLINLDADMAGGKNIRIRLIEKGFVILIAIIVTISIKWVGILIINSLLVLPAAAARNLTKSVRSYHAVSVGLSLFSGICGLILSYYFGTAAGGTIVLVAAILFFISVVISRSRIRL